MKTTRRGRFLNVDLDIESSDPLDLLAEDMGGAVTVLHSGPIGRSRHFLRLESSRQPSTPDAGARALCSTVERLSDGSRRLWHKAKRREFNVGCEFQDGIRAVEIGIEPETLRRIVRLGATVAFTCYAADDSEPD